MSATIYETFAECCSICGSGAKSWHHDPPIGGSALDHDFVPSRSVIQALTARGHGRPFLRTEMTDFEYYHLRSWALKGLEAAAKDHAPCAKTDCDICTMREA